MTGTIEQQHTGKMVELITFYLGGSLYGIDILEVKEINKLQDWTSVPHSDEFVLGILSLRGSIVTIIDLGKKLSREQIDITKDTRTVIVSSGGQQVGFLVDAIGSVTTIDWERVCDPPANVNGIQGQFLEGVLKTDNDLIAILDIKEVFKHAEANAQKS